MFILSSCELCRLLFMHRQKSASSASVLFHNFEVRTSTSSLYKSKVNPISQLRGVTCHMKSQSVTFHPTQVNTPPP